MTTTDARTARIRELNDLARKTMGVTCHCYQTQGINGMSHKEQSEIREKVEKFVDFNGDNDPWGEHDFGSFEHNGEKVFWIIDYYDPDMQHRSDHPEDPAQTRRVLTIMLAEEY